MEQSRLAYLFDKYVQKKCTQEEKVELMTLINLAENENEVKNLIDEMANRSEIENRMDEGVANYILSKILKDDSIPVFPEKGKTFGLRFWLRTAAAIIIIVVASYWFIDRTNQNNQIADSAHSMEKSETILPGGDHAVLTLADGSTILLDSIQNGNLQQGGLKMSKQDGLLVFEGIHEDEKSVSWNTLSTPRGGQYKVVLPDGSEVWLNASSSIRFPNIFTGRERNVEITGEAYFEVAKNKEMPFHVNVDDMQIEVLGTHFNVNAYRGEPGIKTSLLEGSVKITDGKTSGLLKPGQQGVIKSGETKLKIENFDVEEVMAWKNGLFVFNGDDIVSIMNQIGRWYDVGITFSGNVPRRSFEGKISRDAPLSDVLKILELSGVKFSVVGKQVIVE